MAQKTGWNGSLTPAPRERLRGDPCPPQVREKLNRLRMEAALRAAVYRPA